MDSVTFNNAYYIKLGTGGIWEQSCIAESKIRFGWSMEDAMNIQAGDFNVFLERRSKYLPSKQAQTKDLNAMKHLCLSNHHDVWTTFSDSKLWWCRISSPKVFGDQTSRYREVDGWRDTDVHGNLLQINRIPGALSKIQGFRGTVCRVRAKTTLMRLINDEASPQYQNIAEARNHLSESVIDGIKRLHWKDFELLVDLIFRASGWRRLSMLGETMKFADLELEDPITHDKYQVQIKSRANLADFETYSNQFHGRGFRKLYFVVHSPTEELAGMQPSPSNVELILGERLAAMTVELGLVDWLMQHIK